MRLLDRLRERLPPHTVERLWVSAAAATVGIGTGVGVALFRGLIRLVKDLADGELAPLLASWGGWWTVALVPVIGGLIVGPIIVFVIGRERHHGVAGIVEAVAIDGGRLRYRRAPAKVVGAALSIGTGASVGPEDPSVQIGANLGSFLGQKLHLPEERVRMLVVAGAAAGVSAAFGAPIAGVFFALEVVLGDFAGIGVGLVLVTSVLAAFTSAAVSSKVHELTAPKYVLRSGWEIPLHMGLGIILGPFAAIYVRSIDGARDWFERSKRPRWLKPAIAGAAVGVAALWIPAVKGSDYGTMESALQGAQMAIWLLAILGIAKIVLTGACIGAGFPGGVFAPALFAGCMLGGAYGLGAAHFLPSLDISPGAFAMAGMAAFLAAAVHAPLTAVILVFELTKDYGMVGAAMAAVACSLIGAKWIEPESVYSRPLVRKGFHRRALSSYETERALVEGGAPCANRCVKEVPWPNGCVVARIRRGMESFAAHQGVVILAGDEVVAVVDEAARDAFVAMCRRPPRTPAPDAVPRPEEPV